MGVAHLLKGVAMTAMMDDVDAAEAGPELDLSKLEAFGETMTNIPRLRMFVIVSPNASSLDSSS